MLQISNLSYQDWNFAKIRQNLLKIGGYYKSVCFQNHAIFSVLLHHNKTMFFYSFEHNFDNPCYHLWMVNVSSLDQHPHFLLSSLWLIPKWRFVVEVYFVLLLQCVFDILFFFNHNIFSVLSIKDEDCNHVALSLRRAKSCIQSTISPKRPNHSKAFSTYW